jgi:effector-binding domain-containing protein
MTFSAGGSVRVDIVQVRPQLVASVREIIHRDRMTESLGRIFQAVGGVIASQRVAATGPRFARWHSFGEVVDLEAGLPVARQVVPEDAVVPSSLPGGPMAHAIHMGMYEGLEAVYEAISSWLQRSGRQPGEGPWESYTTDPLAEADPERWRTDIYWPLR